MTNAKLNSTFRSNAAGIGTNRFSYNPNDITIKEALPKIGRTNLFNIKKSSSQIFLKKENMQKAILKLNSSKNKNKRTPSINKHEFIIARKKDINNKDSTLNSLQDRSFVVNNFIKRYKSNKKNSSPSNRDSYSTTKNSSVLLNQCMNINKIFLTPDLLINKTNSNDVKEKFQNLKKKITINFAITK